MTKIEPLNQNHIDKIQPKSSFGETQYVRDRLKNSIGRDALVLVVNDNPIAVFGFNFIWNGVAHMWTVTTDLVKNHKLAFCKHAEKVYSYFAEQHNIHRLQFTARADDLEIPRWAKFLGFTQESVMKEYGADKTDYIMFVRVF